jgi:tetratricopeptide (TPR) repeat protein/transglutaminase-like putative cysteine protease
VKPFALPVPCFLPLLWTLLLLAPSSAWASGQPELEQALDDLSGARGPEAYTAIRRVWAQWGSTDPRHVEQALIDASESKALSAPVRAYAGFLAAHARTRRGDPAGARRAIASLGFVDSWLIVGPFDNEGKAGFDVDYGPEAQFAEAIGDGKTYTGKERAVRWRRTPNAFSLGWLDGGSLFRPEQNICFYASTVVWQEPSNTKRPKPISVWVGTSGAFRLFVNGKALSSDTAYRGHDVDRTGATVTLPPGKSRLTVKACGTDSAPVVSVRLAGADGGPDPTLRFRADFDETAEASSNFERLEVHSTDLGPISEFEKRVARTTAKAADLEAYARYLVASSADDPTVHRARDLARRAAEAEPTLERLLLAGELSEDYNQHRQWVEKAEALASRTKPPPIDLVLARAAVERSGLNWRDAFPHYARALALDPDDLRAIRGRVELFNDAGMGRSAAALLERAIERNPYAVTLLNMRASQLRALGRIGEAEEVERRYAQFRFDDHSYITEKLDLALVRGERATAEHWLERLLETHPDSLWVRSVAARAYRRLSQPERAIEAYRAALALAPEDVSTLRALSDLHGQLGQAEEQLQLLRQILAVKPQAKEIHEYLRNIEPEKPKQDEAYAWSPDQFLKDRAAAAQGENKRTLLNLTVTTVFDNGLSSQFRQVVFQPLVDSAAALSQDYYFGYQADSQRVQLRGARVFRGDGRVDEAVETSVGDANDPSIAMYTSARTFIVRFPRLEAGDVVELRYRLDDVAQRNEFADYFGEIQHFQDSESVGHAEYVLITPKRRTFFFDQQRIPKLKNTVDEKADQRIYRFSADSLPPIHPEPAMPPWPEVLGFVHVSTYRNYQELGKWYWGLAKDQFDLDEETRRLAREITRGLTTEREKVQAVYNWVVKNTRYVALEFGIYGFKPRRCVQTVSRGWGDCKDKATVIVSLLEELGIESTIVIVRTQMRGRFQSSVASLASFDHAIAYVPSLDLYLDGTAEYTGSTELPAMDQQALGILVNGGQSELVTLPLSDPRTNIRDRKFTAKLDPSGAAKVTLAAEVRGTQASSWRRRYHAEATQRERATTDLAREFPGFQLDPGPAAFSARLDDYEQPVRLTLSGRSPTYGRREGDNLSVAVTTHVRLTESYASLSTRRLDVAVPVFGTVRDTFEITLPPGYRVLSAPAETSATSRFGVYSVGVDRQGSTVKVTSEIRLDVTRVKPAQYAEWQRFCQAADAAMTPRLVVGR